jgi:hypothetical protein
MIGQLEFMGSRLDGMMIWLLGFYPPTQKTTPACRNTWKKRFGKGRHFSVQARVLPVDKCVSLGWIIHAPQY